MPLRRPAVTVGWGGGGVKPLGAGGVTERVGVAGRTPSDAPLRRGVESIRCGPAPGSPDKGTSDDTVGTVSEPMPEAVAVPTEEAAGARSDPDPTKEIVDKFDTEESAPVTCCQACGKLGGFCVSAGGGGISGPSPLHTARSGAATAAATEAAAPSNCIRAGCPPNCCGEVRCTSE